MKKYSIIFLIFAISFMPIIISPTLAGDVPDSTNSSIFLAGHITEINPLTQVVITVSARNSTNFAIQNANIHITATDGLFVSTMNSQITDVSDNNGFFNATWKSPQVSFDITSLPVSFNATIENNGTSIDISTSVVVKHLTTFAIDNSALSGPSQVESNHTAILSVQVKDGNDQPTENVQVTYQPTTDGEYISPQTQGLTNNNGFFNISWQAPVLIKENPNLNITITVVVNASATISKTIQKTIMVVFNIGSLDVKVSLNTTLFDQTDIMLSTLSITDHTSHLPVPNVNVYLTAELGIFLESDSSLYAGVTDNNGNFTARFTAPDEDLLVQVNNVSITYTISISTYNDVTGSYSFSVNKKASTYSFTAIPTADSIQFMDTVTFQFSAKKNSINLVNATFKIIATGGHFVNNDTIFSAKTNSSGLLEIIWYSDSLVPSIDSQIIYFDIQFVNSGLSHSSQTVTVSFANYSSQSTNSDQSNGISDLLPLAGGILLLGIVGVGAFVAFSKFRK